MNERLKKIRTSKNLTLAKFGESIGLSPGAVSDMERGRRGITDQTIRSICREYHVNEEWFKNGTGEMFMADSGDEHGGSTASSSSSGLTQFILDIAK